VVEGLASIYSEWIRRYGLDGFRVDTARHVNAGFFGLWAPKILAAARAAGRPGFSIFGEVAISDALTLSDFVRSRGLPEVLDFPLQDAATGFAAGTSSARAVSDRLADDDYFRGPSGVNPSPPTFLGNHDMGRAAYQLLAHGAADDASLEPRLLLAYDLLYLLRGAPVVYYGDEVGMIGRGGDQAARQDLFPTGVEEWQGQRRVGSPPIGAGSSFDVEGPIQRRLRELAGLREAHPALSTGATVVLLASRSLLVVSRIDRTARREYVAAFNAAGTSATATIATSTPSTEWQQLLGGSERPGTDGRGFLTFPVPAYGSTLLVASSALPSRAPARPVLSVAADSLTALRRLSVRTRVDAGLTVGFAVRRGSGAWRRVAVDDSPPYRAFVDPATFRRGERVAFVAIARSLDGRVQVSPVVTAAPRP
jgi:hypothetical protein